MDKIFELTQKISDMIEELQTKLEIKEDALTAALIVTYALTADNKRLSELLGCYQVDSIERDKVIAEIDSERMKYRDALKKIIFEAATATHANNIAREALQ